jgi:hypothetical protein
MGMGFSLRSILGAILGGAAANARIEKQKPVHIEQEPQTITLKILAFGTAPHTP